MQKTKKIINESLKNQIKKYLPVLMSKLSKEKSVDTIKTIFNADPTKNSERGEQFAGGLLKLYSDNILDNEEVEPIENFLKYVDKYFDYFQNLNFNSYGVKKKKLNQFKDLNDFYNYISLIDKKKVEIDEDGKWKDLEGVFPIIANNKDWVVFYIQDREKGVSCLGKYGSFMQTSWCTFDKDSKYWKLYKEVNTELLLFWNKKEKIKASEKLILLAMAKGISEGGVPSKEEKDMVQAFEINNLLNKRSRYSSAIKKFINTNKDKIIEKSKSEYNLAPLLNKLKDFGISKNILWWLENSPKESFDKIADEFLILNKEGYNFLKNKHKNGEMAELRFKNEPNFEEKIFANEKWGNEFFIFYNLKNKDFLLYYLSKRKFVHLDSSLRIYQFNKDDMLDETVKARLFIEIMKLIGVESHKIEDYHFLLTNMKDKIDKDFQFINIDKWFKPLFPGFSVLEKKYIELLKNTIDRYGFLTSNDFHPSRIFKDRGGLFSRQFYNILDRDDFLIIRADEENKIFPVGIINTLLITNWFTTYSDTYHEFASGGIFSFVNEKIKDSKEDLITLILEKYFNINKNKFVFHNINSLYLDYSKIFHFILIKHKLITRNKKKIEEAVKTLYFGSDEICPIPLSGSLKTEMETHLGERFGGVDILFKKNNSRSIKLSSSTPLKNNDAKKLRDIPAQIDIFTYRDINKRTININNLNIEDIYFENCNNIRIKNNNKVTKNIWIKKSCSNVEIELKNDISYALYISAKDTKVIGNGSKVENLVAYRVQNKVIFKDIEATKTHLLKISEDCNIFFDNCKINGIRSNDQNGRLIFRNTNINDLSPFINGEENKEYKSYFDYDKDIRVVFLDYHINNQNNNRQ